MIPDWLKTKLYVSALLPERLPQFYNQFCKELEALNIEHTLLPHTSDIWARDYMPIQVKLHKLIHFTYTPDYLQSPEWQSSQTNAASVLNAIKLDYMSSPIILDGGNISCCSDKAILTDKVFTENKHFGKAQLLSQLEQLFETDKIFFVPRQPYDYLRHVDGMLRFLNEDTLLVNDYSLESKTFVDKLKKALKSTGLNIEPFPYSPYQNIKTSSAVGTYINYLQMQQGILLPTFNLPTDEQAYARLKELLPKAPIRTIDCQDLANQDGVLNCISWNLI